MQKINAKYTPMYVKARPWDQIELFYTDLLKHNWDVGRMVDLIRHIKSTGLSERLFGFTSLDILHISIYDPLVWGTETLCIKYCGEKEGWGFKYLSKPFQPLTFERKYPADKGIENFDQFNKMINW